MVVFNRVLLSIMFAIIAAASLIGVFLLAGFITSDQVNSVIPFRQAITFFRTNLTVSSLISILALIVVLALSVLWLRAQYREAVTSMVGGWYEIEGEGPGLTSVNYDVTGKAIDNLIKPLPGVVDSQTRIYSERDGQLFAQTSLILKRNTDVHEIDDRIRDAINQEWFSKLGIEFARHDILISLEPVERRVA